MDNQKEIGMSKETGGPAFPVHGGYEGDDPRNLILGGGVSVRDYFAGKALSGLVASMSDDFVRQQFIDRAKQDHTSAKQQVARCAYEYADEMLIERAK